MNAAQIIYYYGFGGGNSSPDTTADGKRVALIVSDSITVTSDGTAPTPNANVLYEWDGSAVVNVTDDLATRFSGTFAPQFANDYNANTGYKTVFVNAAKPGSEYSPNGNTDNWSTSGTLYDAAIADCDACLDALNLSLPFVIFVSLGINDARGAVSLTTIKSDMDSLYSRLTAKYPGVPILIMQIGSSESSIPVDSRIGDLRKHTKQLVLDNADLHFCAPLTSMRAAGYYDTDFLHLKQTGQNEIGKMFARWFANSSYSKWARSIIASHFDDLSTARKNLIETFVSTEVYQNADMFFNFKTTTKNNAFLDWCFLSLPLDVGTVTFTANDSITTTATGSKYLRCGFIPSVMAMNTAQNDFLHGIKVKANRTTSGTVGSIFTCTNTAQMMLEQTTTPGLLYRANDGTLNQYTGHTAWQNDSFYATGRNSGTKYLRQNNTQLASASVASTGQCSGDAAVGGRNAAGTVTQIVDADFEYAIHVKYTISNIADVYTNLESLSDNWNV